MPARADPRYSSARSVHSLHRPYENAESAGIRRVTDGKSKQRRKTVNGKNAQRKEQKTGRSNAVENFPQLAHIGKRSYPQSKPLKIAEK